jgi:hypothetical protein
LIDADGKPLIDGKALLITRSVRLAADSVHLGAQHNRCLSFAAALDNNLTLHGRRLCLWLQALASFIASRM